MTIGQNLLLKLAHIATVVDGLPVGADVTIQWSEAPPDLLLLLAQQENSAVRSVRWGDGERDEAEWACGSVVVRASRICRPPEVAKVKLTLVKL